MAGCTQPEDFKCPKIKKISTVVHAGGKAKAAFLASRPTVVPDVRERSGNMRAKDGIVDGHATAASGTMQRGATIAVPNQA